MFPAFSWRSLTLPPRHFAWRVRGNPLYWGLEERTVLESDYDALVATSMVDLCTLRGLVPALTRLPTLLYFHENQFAYPRGRGRHEPLEGTDGQSLRGAGGTTAGVQFRFQPRQFPRRRRGPARQVARPRAVRCGGAPVRQGGIAAGAHRQRRRPRPTAFCRPGQRHRLTHTAPCAYCGWGDSSTTREATGCSLC